MRIADYDRLISVWKIKEPPDLDPNTGTEIVAWVPLVPTNDSPPTAVRFWANAKDVLPSYSEAVKMGLPTAREQVRIRIYPWRDDLNSAMRITLHGRGGEADQTFQIVAGPATFGNRESNEVMAERYSS